MNPTPRSRLLLVELICDFVIFALCAVVCVTLLVKARSMSRASTELTRAVYLAQEAVETERYESYEMDGYQITILSTPNWTDVPLYTNYVVSKDGREIYTLQRCERGATE